MNKEDKALQRLSEELEAAQQRIQTLEGQLASQNETVEALSEDHSFRAAVIERAAEGVCVCHDIPEFPFIEFSVWNQRMVEITGYSMEEINDRGWYQTMYPDPDLRERARARMDRMRQEDDLDFERWEITRANGEKSPVSISTSVITARHGSVHVLGLIHDISERERLETESMLARVDVLTGVRNRRGFLENAELLFRLAARQNQPVTVAYLDVDDLKSTNDRLGHDEGDRLLRVVGDELSRTFRSSDVVGRLGGDEFAAVLLGPSESDVNARFARLQKRLMEIFRERGWKTGVSIGVVMCTGAEPDLENAIKYADTLMYRAKKSGNKTLVCEKVTSLDLEPKASF